MDPDGSVKTPSEKNFVEEFLIILRQAYPEKTDSLLCEYIKNILKKRLKQKG